MYNCVPEASVLHFMTIGNDAVRVCSMTDKQLLAAINYITAKLYKDAKVISFSHPNWSNDENYMGAYTNAPILSETENLEDFYNELASPIDSSFYFVGEAYDYVNGGFMQGAHNTAVRVSDQILQNYS